VPSVCGDGEARWISSRLGLREFALDAELTALVQLPLDPQESKENSALQWVPGLPGLAVDMLSWIWMGYSIDRLMGCLLLMVVGSLEG